MKGFTGNNFTGNNFTGNKDVDRSILLGLNDVDLSNICATNTYFKSLCSEESFWRTKTLSRFGKYLGGIEEIEKYRTMYPLSWKSYYISLVDFLEKKYLGYFVPSIGGSRKIIRKFEDYRMKALRRDDIKKLNDIIDKNDAMLIENIERFLSKISSVKTFDVETFTIFMVSQLNNDMLNPSVIFSINPSHGRRKIEQFLEQIITYLLNSKDRRIHPEYFDNEFLKNLFSYVDLFEEIAENIAIILLRDPRVDPNSALNEIASNVNIPIDLIDLVLSDPRIKVYNLRETIKEYIEDPDGVAIDGLLKIFEAFLEKGGTLDELKYMVENIETRDEGVTVYYEQFIINHSNTLKDQIISKLSYERYSDDIYEKILSLLNN